MPRPRRCRRVGGPPGTVLFKPAGVPSSRLTELVLGIDELEAIRLADLEGLYQEQAAEQMHVSRQTFGRIISVARGKVAKALVEGMSLRIEGGEIEMEDMRKFRCSECEHEWQEPFGTGRPDGCPKCHSTDFRRTDGSRGSGTGRGGACIRSQAGTKNRAASKD
jgi:predicted DNA-binding protein (UPF0251 family)